jgi:ABC-type lipoprotein release transport system permease subunit
LNSGHNSRFFWREALGRGLRNARRSRTRATVVTLLLAAVMGTLAVMMQVALVSRERIASLEARVRTLVELREAGAFGTGGFGGDKRLGEEDFTTDTLAAVRRIPNSAHIARVDEYVYAPQIDPSKRNAYAMVIGLRPGAALRAIGEVDYENARLLAGRSFADDDASRNVAIVGRLYARQRLGIEQIDDAALDRRSIDLNGVPFRLVGIYTTANDFGDNHVFVPIDPFRQVFRPGKKLSKIFVTVDSVANVERVVGDLRQLREADVVTAPEAVSTARTTLASLALASFYTIGVLGAIGIALVVGVMMLSLRERTREIGTMKALGAPDREIVVQLTTEAAAFCALGAVGAAVVAGLGTPALHGVLDVPPSFDIRTILSIAVGAAVFAVAGSFYPVIRAKHLSPVEAMRSTE